MMGILASELSGRTCWLSMAASRRRSPPSMFWGIGYREGAPAAGLSGRAFTLPQGR